ncbi:ribosome small subunit-dependent GTPase A [Salibacteraceae bacterium]|jgi:ribosome biogenesis GTPase / thiamine phosphate phosphatase|nr:ribosome small subunit-dependent GTPase A [Salibacteraceae bacterium]MDB4104031.1 ribosome small subunit-dependent GTPase A [Salibacteraceae bacterium]MDB9709231.1 ribosome small subunit-dependent GTPase A [Salibacteraceae bacterium]MDC1304594.1 ribosome small subunit-dependent GTPase A [Salibacteraceae bacterium]HAQ71973.1 ribosome small subunit-dependent GTPase A [Flavobacteriales bacterium]
MKALVVKSTGSWYKVRLEDGSIIDARSRGKLRTANSRNTNHITVGDIVDIDTTGEDYSISKIYDRKNYIIRKSTNLSKETHIIAANIDLAVMVTSLKEPKLKFGFVDRFLVTAAAYQIPAVIVFNKTDLLNESELEYLENLREAYRNIGYESEAISVNDNEGIETIETLISGKISLFSGTSGVGKSSLLNALNPEIDAKVSVVSTANEKGQHTTTFAEMHQINSDSFIIDTPGLKSFGLIDMEPEELKDYFPEMVKLSENCKFGNCKHINEPGCAVKPEFEESRLPIFRYENYIHLYKELEGLKKGN